MQEPVEKSLEEEVRRFIGASAYTRQGAVITDLDGTVVHEYQGVVVIPPAVVMGLKDLYDVGRPLVINTLRFPLSVLRSFGAEWHGIANAPVPVVALNGSQLGYMTRNAAGELDFEEITAFPLGPGEVEEVLAGIRGLLDNGLRDILVFYYPRDWRVGEVIWTPSAARVAHVKAKYPSASAVTSVEFGRLADQLRAEPICMLCLFIDAPDDQLMAYQHARRSNFFTARGVDKLHGAVAMARHLGVDLPHSIGAGDTEMDTFLNGVGLALVVGETSAHFRGLVQTLRVRNAIELGHLLFRLADLHRQHAA